MYYGYTGIDLRVSIFIVHMHNISCIQGTNTYTGIFSNHTLKGIKVISEDFSDTEIPFSYFSITVF